jgi:hypothetical protein
MKDRADAREVPPAPKAANLAQRRVAMAETAVEQEGAGDAFGESKGKAERGAGAGMSVGVANRDVIGGTMGGVVGGVTGGVVGGRVAGPGKASDQAVAQGAPARRASKPARSRAAASAQPMPAAPMSAAPAAAPMAAAPMPAATGAAATEAAPAEREAPSTREARLGELERLQAALPHLQGESRARALERICALERALGQGEAARATLKRLRQEFPNSEAAARAAQQMATPATPDGE